jgi:hypothetical protein
MAMFDITDAHIDLILDDLSARGLRIDDLRNNLVDHICVLAELDLRDGDDFEAWYRRVIPTFYRQQLSELEEETEFLLKHQGRFAVLSRLQFFLLLFVILVGPIACWVVTSSGWEMMTPEGVVHAWEAGLVFAIFPMLLLAVLFLTPDRYEPLLPRRAKIWLGRKPLISIIPPRDARPERMPFAY